MTHARGSVRHGLQGGRDLLDVEAWPGHDLPAEHAFLDLLDEYGLDGIAGVGQGEAEPARMCAGEPQPRQAERDERERADADVRVEEGVGPEVGERRQGEREERQDRPEPGRGLEPALALWQSVRGKSDWDSAFLYLTKVSVEALYA